MHEYKQIEQICVELKHERSVCVCVYTFLILPVVKFHTSMNPSTEPVTRY